MPTLAETLFSIAGLVVLPGWALLVFLPWWRWSTDLVPGVIIPAVLSLLYGGLLATNFFGCTRVAADHVDDIYSMLFTASMFRRSSSGCAKGRLFRRCNVALSGASRHATIGDTYIETVNLPVPDRWGEPQNILTV